jgi:hypothetical protein
MTAADLQRVREETRRNAWNGANFIVRRAIVEALGWPSVYAWREYAHLDAAERVAIAEGALILADATRRVSDVALAGV